MGKQVKMRKGFTLIELLLSIAILGILVVTAAFLIKPGQTMAKKRDAQRISDLSRLQIAIESFALDHKATPGDMDTYHSDNGTDAADGTGWIHGSNMSDMPKYIGSLPMDPINQGEFVYRYQRDPGCWACGYEIDAKLETDTQKMANDGGDDSNRYEVGSELNLLPAPTLSPSP